MAEQGKAMSLIHTNPKLSKQLIKKIDRDFERTFNQLTRAVRKTEGQIKRQDYRERSRTIRERNKRTGGQRRSLGKRTKTQKNKRRKQLGQGLPSTVWQQSQPLVQLLLQGTKHLHHY